MDDANGRRYTAMTLQDCSRVSGPFLHGTRAALQAGDELVPGRFSSFHPGRVMNPVYFTSLLDTAVWGAELAVAQVLQDRGGAGQQGLAEWGAGERGHVYEVEPVGSFEDDPNVTNEKFPGNVMQSYRSRHPLRVVREVLDRPGRDRETLQDVLHGLRVLGEQGCTTPTCWLGG